MKKQVIGFALVAALSGTPALAQDPTGYHAISAGNLASAERTLVAERRIYPRRPELMLNLAAVYERTGRAAEARALYRGVLSGRAIMMELPGGRAASSHALANAGLAKLGPEQIVSR